MKLHFYPFLRIITFIATTLFATGFSFAHDFEVNGIYYNITNSNTKTVEVTYFGGNFNNNSNTYTGEYSIPSSVTDNGIEYSVNAIGDWAFYGCSNLTAITLPNSIKTIGGNAFHNCSNLKSIIIPNSVTIIKINAFKYCSNLDSVTIGNSVTSIGCNAFYFCSKLSSLYIPESVTEIGSEAFYGCNSLVSINIPNKITKIEYNLFNSCSSLTSIIIPNSVTSIGYNAFKNCGSLTSVTIPNSVTAIGNGAFENCTKISSFSIPPSVTSIGYNILYNTEWYNNQAEGILYLDHCCLGYKGEAPTGILSIAESTRIISDKAFYECDNITSITMSNSIKRIGAHAFYGCIGIPTIIIPTSITSIGTSAFNGCTNLQTINFLAENCSSMGNYDGLVFGNCPLRTLNIGESVKTIPNYAFDNCNFSLLRIPKSVTYIASSNMHVDVCYCYNPTPPSGGGCSTNRLFVPKGSLTAYALADGWKNANQISEFDAGSETKHTFTIAYPEGGVINQKVTDGECLELQIVPTSGWEYNTITFNDVDITNQLDTNGNYLTLPITSDCRLSVVFVKNDDGIANTLISNDIKIYTQGKTVTISGASESSIVEIYDTSGVKIYSGFEKAITLDTNGIYILSTEGHIFKFALYKE